MPTLTAFLTPETGTQVREQHGPADLVCLNNVYAHIPDVVGFTEGLRAMVADDGWVSIEVQHLLTLVEHTPVRHRLPRALPVLHGAHRPAGARLGRADAGRRRAAAHPRRLDPHVGAAQRGRGRAEPGRARRARRRGSRRACTPPRATTGSPRPSPGCATTSSRSSSRRAAAGKKVVGYGAPGKGNTLLNYCGIRPDLLAYTVDRNPYKHGRFTPGTRIPILAPEQIAEDQPDYVLILPWNLRDELTAQLSYVRDVGRQAGLPDPAPRGRLSGANREGRPVLRRLRHADARRRSPTCPSR